MMPYIDRDSQDRVIGIYECPQYPDQEFVDAAEMYVPPPAPIQVIRSLEAPFDDDFKKVQRQFLIAALFKEAKEHPAAAGLSDAQIHDYLMNQGKAYAVLYTLEQQIIPWRALIP